MNPALDSSDKEKEAATRRSAGAHGKARSRKPKLFSRLVTATRTDNGKARVYLINMNEIEGTTCAAVEIQFGRPGGLPTAIDVALGKWILDCTPPSDPSGSLAALVRLAGEERARAKAFNASSSKKQNEAIESRLRYSEKERKELAARGRVPLCDFKPDDVSVKWNAACEWDHWNERGLQWGERMIAMEQMGFSGFAKRPLTTFQTMCERALGLKIVKS
jgi:hypothetical protein